MKKPLRVLLDVDGVVADFQQLYVMLASATLGRDFSNFICNEWDVGDALHLTQAEKDKVHALLDAPNTGQLLLPMEGATVGVFKLRQMVDELYFVTTSLGTNPTWDFDRKNWIKRYFGEELSRKICFVDDKFIVDGTVLVDDKPKNLDLWKEKHPEGHTLLWSHPFNAGDKNHFRVFSWEDVHDIVRTLRS